MVNYVSEYSRTGTTTSSTELFEKMYFHIKPKTLLFGDGIYETAFGYYMNTDAGYMRPILYFGIPGLLLLFGLQLLYFQNKYFLSRKNKYIIITYLLIMQIKGEVVGFSIIIETVMLLFFFALSLMPNSINNQGSKLMKISCIMSNYNTPSKYLRLALESVLCQTFKNISDNCG